MHKLEHGQLVTVALKFAEQRKGLWLAPITAILLGAATGPAVPVGRSIPASTAAQLIPYLEGGQWMSRRKSDNSCPKLYMLDTRTCPYCMAFMRKHYASMEKDGYDIRLHYAAVAGEGSGTIAEIGFRRDIRVLLMHQLGSRRANGPDPSDAGGARLTAFNSLVETTNAIRSASRGAGFPAFLPTFVWQDRNGRWKISSGYDDTVPVSLRSSLPKPSASCRQ